MRSQLPLLLLDVDGVLCPFSRTSMPGRDTRYPGFEYNPDYHVHTSTTVAEQVYDLLPYFEVHWCTGWVKDANSVGRCMGLPEFPHVPLDNARVEDPHWKWRPIKKYIRQRKRPYAFLDDEITDEAIEIARASGEPHSSALWLPVICDEGMNRGHVQRLIRWANEISLPV